jgi:hypothetical protein
MINEFEKKNNRKSVTKDNDDPFSSHTDYTLNNDDIDRALDNYIFYRYGKIKRLSSPEEPELREEHRCGFRCCKPDTLEVNQVWLYKHRNN